MKIPIPIYTIATYHPISANALTDADLTKLANLLKTTPIPLKIKVYAGVAQGKMTRDVTSPTATATDGLTI